MGDYFESMVANDVSQSSLRRTPTLWTWTETTTFFGASDTISAGKFLPMEAVLTGTEGIVNEGDLHPVYPDAVCQSVTLEPRTQDSTVHLVQVAQYAQPGPKCSVQYDSYQQTEIRNFAETSEDAAKAGLTSPPSQTNLTTVTYAPANFAAGSRVGPTEVGAPIGPTINLAVPFVANIPVPSIVRAIRVSQYEILQDATAVPAAISRPSRPQWNADDIWGFQPGELLYVGVQSVSEGTCLYRRTYTFLINQYLWHHFYAVWVDARGLKPRDIIPINPKSVGAADGTVRTNGAAGFQMLPGALFSDLFTQIKPLFNVGGVLTIELPPTPTGDTDPAGDFLPMPGNFA